ncbi:hypothetical protein SERLA73DRAFT_100280 [Serpula lacrymans var. lacrymans S7.3]|uniref:Asp/Glu/hydantoin racemase n=2 Tax=Serpula lacrymans var. lacrymans TaxID=341189 RepID=F8QJA4_SERL3|nr:uncharacterized protein SERLADRAFT_357555 [Serpula lacrymans var. lacrymans S7.9]EGN91615.1 hypothetical protein SERLA73DRAFT_100280 [Serpula lacrymans var. lacrymans S7.3]EGO21772.1 hypothetical protein SERLADRAFT_357555 [Serpula lacrymans var. lacrymans S7.9]
MAKISVLIVNPNTTEYMTNQLKPIVSSLEYSDTAFTFFTSPSGPPSINDNETALKSAEHSLPHLKRLIDTHDGFLVACYSVHPLVKLLKERTRKPVVGIFEASITTCLQLIGSNGTFGIVSTGYIWEKLLREGVYDMLGVPRDDTAARCSRFAGVQTTGLDAIELHETPAEKVQLRIADATKRLIRSNNQLEAICLGCAAMAGLQDMIRQACIDELGGIEGSNIMIIDGVKAGVGILVGLVKGQFA